MQARHGERTARPQLSSPRRQRHTNTVRAFVAVTIAGLECQQVITGQFAADARERVRIGADLAEHGASGGASHARDTVVTHLQIARRSRRDAVVRGLDAGDFNLQAVDRDARRLRLGGEPAQVDAARVDDHTFGDEHDRLGSRQVLQARDQGLQGGDRSPGQGVRELRHRPRLLLYLLGAGVAPAA